MRASVSAWARVIATVAVVAGLDQATKALALAKLERGEPVNVFFGVDLTLVRNSGIAFGALPGQGTTIALLTGTALVLLVIYFARHSTRTHLWLPVGMLLGGALGNLVDRAREGAVLDFIDPVAWPAFNLADVAIVCGVLGLLYVMEGVEEEEAPDEQRKADEEEAPDGHATAAEAADEQQGGEQRRAKEPTANARCE